MSIRLVQQFLKHESSSGIILFFVAVIAMVWANSPLDYLLETFKKNYLFEINEGLMTLFFLLVGLELKRGFVEGPLSDISQIISPAVAAIGGMVAPALIYLYFNAHHSATAQGWATPVATDIAFALGVLSLFGRKIPSALKLFLLALAIFDDIGAIIIIAVAYSHGIAYTWLAVIVALIGLLYILKKYDFQSLVIYLGIGALLWTSVYQAGLHPTIAGVLLAMMIPITKNRTKSPLHRLENQLHPWVIYLVMPLFALANAGFSLQDLNMNYLLDNVVLGIIAGLFIGKQVGVFGVTWVLVKLRLLSLPPHTSWLAFYGVALICGIGFTMSLFLGTLSFQGNELYLSEVRMGVMLGSLLSGLSGAGILYIAFKDKGYKHAK